MAARSYVYTRYIYQFRDVEDVSSFRQMSADHSAARTYNFYVIDMRGTEIYDMQSDDMQKYDADVNWACEVFEAVFFVTELQDTNLLDVYRNAYVMSATLIASKTPRHHAHYQDMTRLV